MNTTPTELDTLLQAGWAEHAEETEAVATRLEAGIALASDAPQAARYMSLVTHVIGDHLGDRARARQICETVVEGLGSAADTDVFVYLSAARRLADDHPGAAAAQRLAGPDPALGIRIGLIVAQGLAHAADWEEADTVYRAMLAGAEAMEPGHSAERSVAVVSNNVASELLGCAERDERSAALMATAAEAAYTYWSRIGTWVNKERGEYLLSQVYRALGDPKTARAWAERGLDTIAHAGGEEVVDQVFLHIARAAACRDEGDGEAHSESLVTASAMASDFDDPGLIAWFRQEHTKAL